MIISRTKFLQTLLARSCTNSDFTGELQSEYYYFQKQTLQGVFTGVKSTELVPEQWKNVISSDDLLFTLFPDKNPIFQENNAPVHTVNVVTKLHEKHSRVVEHLSCLNNPQTSILSNNYSAF